MKVGDSVIARIGRDVWRVGIITYISDNTEHATIDLTKPYCGLIKITLSPRVLYATKPDTSQKIVARVGAEAGT